ncbi:MerR family transcriptional regulator [Nocardiopsis quinghaiensis]|uniref:MerR family transcriptional regulator n=1 Tax=Nocardiopsis quinghaiensis TaxID=464995 RepID=UPI001CC2386E|nr:MerR family transcriptional regulator [Nocardiopsis quinghaiensis]
MTSHGHAPGGLSPKALRLYEGSGLLVPHRVDPRNGYRSYLVEQVVRARRIRLLRRMETPLSVVAQVMAVGGEEAAERVERRCVRGAVRWRSCVCPGVVTVVWRGPGRCGECGCGEGGRHAGSYRPAASGGDLP